MERDDDDAQRGKRDRDVDGSSDNLPKRPTSNSWCEEQERGTSSVLWNPQMRDPIAAQVYPYLINPGPLRLACTFMVECVNHSAYLEAHQPCPYLTPIGDTDNRPRVTPVQFKRWGNPFADVSFLCQLHLVDLDHITSLGKLCSCDGLDLPPRLVKLRVARLSGLVSVGNDFLRECRELKEAVFEDLPQLTRVGNQWLYASGLERVRLARLPKLNSIGYNFLGQCDNLKEVVLERIPALTLVDHCWLYTCSSLEKIHLAALPKLASIGPQFLSQCMNLKEATFTELPELTSVDWGWLHGCKALERVRLAGLPKLESPGEGFLSGCMSLATVEVGPHCHDQLAQLAKNEVGAVKQ